MTTTAVENEWLTTEEAADIIGIDEQTLRAWRSRGRAGRSRNGKSRKPPKSYKVGAKVRYKRVDLNNWLEAGASE